MYIQHLMKISEVLDVTDGKLIYGNPEEYISKISIDSRNFNAGETFLAIKGKNFDGHNFIDEVIQKGAKAIIIHDPQSIVHNTGCSIILVKDTLTALGQLAAAHRQKFQIPIIAVTGSNGKTTTKEMIASVLSQWFLNDVVKSKGSFNNNVGLPLTLLELRNTTKAVVIEIGMNHPGEIDRLAQLAQPTIGVLTNIGESHIGNLGSKENIALAKAELLRHINPKGEVVPLSAVCLNRDDPYIWQMRNLFSGKIISYGLSKEAKIRASNLIQEAQKIRFVFNDNVEIEISVLGLYNVYNALAAIAIGLYLDIELTLIKKALSEFTPPQWRMNINDVSGVRFINDAYNANPVSMREALITLNNLPVKGRRIVVMGDMLELGLLSEELHRQIGDFISQTKANILITVGELSRFTALQAESCGVETITCSSNQEVTDKLQQLLKSGDCVLFKGSREMKLEEIIKKYVL